MPPTQNPNSVQETKLRSLARSRWKNGCSAVSVWMRKIQKPSAATTASIHDLRRAEPVLVGAPVHHQLERADENGERAETEEIERSLPPAGVVGHEAQEREDGQRPDRDVDVENPAPGEVLGEPAAERRPDDRAHDHRCAPDRHHLRNQPLRVEVEHHRLRQRDQRCARDALQEAEQHHLRQVLRHAAEHRGDGEAGDRRRANIVLRPIFCDSQPDSGVMIAVAMM